MIFSVRDNTGSVLFDNTRNECSSCIDSYTEECRKINCPINGEERRLGVKQHREKNLFLCSSNRSTKTSKLFKEKIEFLAYIVPSMEWFREEIKNRAINEEREKYSKIVHNLKTLNAQSLLSQYNFIPQDAFTDNFSNLFSYILNEIKTRPKDATITLIRQAKNNTHMQTEFSTHEKLSLENPILFSQVHNIRKVILNVYHSFYINFQEKKIALKIDDVDYKAKFDYDTIRVAIYHLFSNAAKYIADNTPLTIKLTQTGDYVYIDFCMKSLFIFPDEMNSIFDDHISGRIAKSRSLQGDGLGMGLIMKALKLNNASIEVLPGVSKIKLGNTDYGDNIFRLKFYASK
jgi:hypothetical protein